MATTDSIADSSVKYQVLYYDHHHEDELVGPPCGHKHDTLRDARSCLEKWWKKLKERCSVAWCPATLCVVVHDGWEGWHYCTDTPEDLERFADVRAGQYLEETDLLARLPHSAVMWQGAEQKGGAK